MEKLNEETVSPTPELTKDKDPRNVYKAVLFLLNRGLKDKVFSV